MTMAHELAGCAVRWEGVASVSAGVPRPTRGGNSAVDRGAGHSPIEISPRNRLTGFNFFPENSRRI